MTHCTENCPANLAASPAGIVDSIAQSLRQWLQSQRLKRAIQQERAQLLTLSNAMLDDIGVSRAKAEHEARRTDIPLQRKV